MALRVDFEHTARLDYAVELGGNLVYALLRGVLLVLAVEFVFLALELRLTGNLLARLGEDYRSVGRGFGCLGGAGCVFFAFAFGAGLELLAAMARRGEELAERRIGAWTKIAFGAVVILRLILLRVGFLRLSGLRLCIGLLLLIRGIVGIDFFCLLFCL